MFLNLLRNIICFNKTFILVTEKLKKIENVYFFYQLINSWIYYSKAFYFVFRNKQRKFFSSSILSTLQKIYEKLRNYIQQPKMKVSPKETPRMTKTLSQGNISRTKFRNDSARFRQPATVHKQDVPILSDSLLRRIDHARHLNNQNSQIQNLPLLPILKSYESRRVLSSSKSGRTNLGSARNLNSAR